jgi:tetratricopeptide (TPR) repeat protein
MSLGLYMDDPDSSKKAISLLDKATTIDSTYFIAHYNKLMFYYQLRQFDKAILTVNKLLELHPSSHDLLMTGGVLYEKTGDTISAKNYFQKSLMICNNVLDTMNTKNHNYFMFITNKAVNLIMLGDSIQANKILKDFYDTQPDEPEYDNVAKNYIQSLMNKNKAQLVEFLSSPEKNQVLVPLGN